MSLLGYKIISFLAFIGLIICGSLYNMDLDSDKDDKKKGDKKDE